MQAAKPLVERGRRLASKAARSALGGFQQRSLDRWRAVPYVSTASPVVVGGCPRSGTTLLRVMLDSHPALCCGPESNLLIPLPLTAKRLRQNAERFDLEHEFVRRLRRTSPSQAEFVDRFFAAYCERRGRPRWAEKTPANVRSLEFIFEHFPEARFVHMIRDGRDAACSLRTHPRHRVVDGKIVPRDTWRPIDDCAQRWVTNVRAGLAFRGNPHYTEVRYEDIVGDPEATLRRLFDWLGEPWSDSVLEYHEVQGGSRDPLRFPQNEAATRPVNAQAKGRWRQNLSPADAQVVERIAGPLLVELGYARDSSWLDEVDSSEPRQPARLP